MHFMGTKTKITLEMSYKYVIYVYRINEASLLREFSDRLYGTNDLVRKTVRAY